MIYTFGLSCRNSFSVSKAHKTAKIYPNDGDLIIMLPLDINKHEGLLERFSEGKFVTFYINDGSIVLASDYDPQSLYDSVMKVKKLSVKPFSEVDDIEAKLIDKNNSGFLKRREVNGLAIHPRQLVSLIRVNPDEAIHFVNTMPDNDLKPIYH